MLRSLQYFELGLQNPGSFPKIPKFSRNPGWGVCWISCFFCHILGIFQVPLRTSGKPGNLGKVTGILQPYILYSTTVSCQHAVCNLTDRVAAVAVQHTKPLLVFSFSIYFLLALIFGPHENSRKTNLLWGKRLEYYIIANL